ncbi:Nramp family divalent metal transporter [Pseudogracilibacillus sp. SE30717A]|uniref:Nramp family divalent metal transporter n=1 Tax=Pseudogracilibacillus sp. SE30717A TaxID=3098293 RepID=UPI00300DF5E5
MEEKKLEFKSNNENEKKGFLKFLGPALITSALVVGPGSLTLASKIGAIYGNQLIWILIITVIFMMIYTEMSMRIGLATKSTFIQLINQKWGKFGGLLIGLGAFLVTTSFQAGNSIGVGIAFSIITGLNTQLLIVLLTILGIVLLFSKNFYDLLEKLMIGLIALMLLSFIITAFLAKPSVGSIASGIIPTIPEGSLGLIIALTATSFSIVGAAYQSYLVKEKGWGITEAKEGAKESYFGIFLLGLITLLVMIIGAAVLKPAGIVVDSVNEMGLTLEPLFGSWATIVFMFGLFGAAFSSLMGNATIGGAMLSDGIGFGNSLKDIRVKITIIAVMLFGSIIALIFGGAPVNMIIFAQAITIVVVPFIAIALLVVANDEKIMGELKNTVIKNVIAIIGLIVLILLAFNNVKNIFFS